jgi:S1-C subfamily serine protease
VLEILRASAAHRFGFRAGDLIVAVNEREVTRVSELQAALKQAGGRWSITASKARAEPGISVEMEQ